MQFVQYERETITFNRQIELIMYRYHNYHWLFNGYRKRRRSEAMIVMKAMSNLKIIIQL